MVSILKKKGGDMTLSEFVNFSFGRGIPGGMSLPSSPIDTSGLKNSAATGTTHFNFTSPMV